MTSITKACVHFTAADVFAAMGGAASAQDKQDANDDSDDYETKLLG